MDKIRNNFLISFNLFLIILCFYISRSVPVKGYEISIYNSLPIYFWLIWIVIIINSLILVYQNGYEILNSKYFLILLILYLFSFLQVSTPFFRYGIIYGRYDAFAHVGRIKDIINLGIIYDRYPIFHISGAFSTLIFSKSIDFSASLVIFILYPLKVFFTYLITREITSKKTVISTAVFISSINFDFSGTYPTPWMLSIFFGFMIVYLIIKICNRDNNFILKIILAFFIIIIVPTHVFTSTILGLTFFISAIIFRFFKKITPVNKTFISSKFLFYGVILLFFSLTWSLFFSDALYPAIKLMLLGYTGGGTEAVEHPHFSWELLAKMYGAVLLLIVFGLIGIITIWRKEVKKINPTAVMISISLIILGFLSISHEVGLRIAGLGTGRILNISFIVLPVFASIGMHNFINIKKSSNNILKYKKYMAVFLIIILLIFSLPKIYPSPYYKTLNMQTPISEIETTNWAVENNNNSYLIGGTSREISLHNIYLVGTTEYNEKDLDYVDIYKYSSIEQNEKLFIISTYTREHTQMFNETLNSRIRNFSKNNSYHKIYESGQNNVYYNQ